MEFSKYQGTGNDFVMVLDLDDERPLKPDEVAAVCDRRTGVGADGVIRVVRTDREGARFFMDYANADGSTAEMCGNGIRCVGRLVHERGLTDEVEFDVLTRAGVKHLVLHEGAGGRRGSRHRGDGSPQLHEGRDPDAGAGLGDVPAAAVRGGSAGCR